MFPKRLILGVLLPAVLLSACPPTGSIVILHNPSLSGFTMDFTQYNATHRCQLPLAARDVVKVEVDRQGGEIGLVVSGLRGSEPYSGNDLPTRTFTIGIAETDQYVFLITGKNATGRIRVKNLGH